MTTYKEQLRGLLTKRLQLEEVKSLYFALDLDEENQTSKAKDGLVRELIRRVEQYGKFESLELWLNENRPDIPLSELLTIEQPAPKPTVSAFAQATESPQPAQSNMKYYVMSGVGLLLMVCIGVFAIGASEPADYEPNTVVETSTNLALESESVQSKPAAATESSLIIFNESDLDVCLVYLSPSGLEDWGPDLLGEDELIEVGYSWELYGIPSGYYDALFFSCNEDFEPMEEYGLDLTEDLEFIISS